VIMQLSIESGVDVNEREDTGSTPLHHSSCKEGKMKSWGGTTIYAGPSRGTVESSHLLLKHGAEMDAKDNKGRTPLDLALEHGREEIARLLSERCHAISLNVCKFLYEYTTTRTS
jgi:ankyrin repeat protein